ncbi:hypothetical protein BACCAP_00388 [Pseudoflavonifractor capillosus ATCC 29799]|uniref:Uncharacterized protein n=1 Tax=Pseudoflavonifractor capillosus ATCC 29799 TaxID=411467 RepID=A6NQB8_9FIRM|nr:hypothetical protein BACCAP_00388 [Pseudoflavonifractor capillosus ATCC 29799]
MFFCLSLEEGKKTPGLQVNTLRGGTFHRRKVPKSRHGATGAARLLQALCARFPLVPPFGVRPAAVQFKQPPYLKATACRFGCLVS